MKLSRGALAAVLAAGMAWAPPAARAQDADSVALRGALESQFLPGVPHRVKAAEAVGGGPLGFVVEVPVKAGQTGGDRARLERLQQRLTAQALTLLARAFPGRSVASWSAVEVVEEGAPPPPKPIAAPRRMPHAAFGVNLQDLDSLGDRARPAHATGPAPIPPPGVDPLADPRLGAPPAAVASPAAPEAEPFATQQLAARMDSLAPSMADKLRRELAPNYPDARVDVQRRGPARVEVWITVITQQPTSANGPFIVDFVRHVVDAVVARDFPGIEIVGGPNIGVRPIEDPDGEDLPKRDNGDWRSRVPIDRKGLSRELEGRLKRELSNRFASVAATVSFVNPHEAIFEIRAETTGSLTDGNREAQREFLRRTVLTLLGNEHPDILPSARSRYTVWSRAPAPHPPEHVHAEAGVSASAPLSALRSRVIELPTAHVLHPDARQYEVTVFQRNVKDGFFTNIVHYDLTGEELAYRQGLIRGLEGALTYRMYQSKVGVRDPSTFAAGSQGQGVLTAALKWIPLRVQSVEFAMGAAQSLVSDLDTAHFLPDEWERLSNVYVVLSAPFAPGFRTSLVALRGLIPSSTRSGAGSTTVLGGAVEWAPFEEMRLALEVVNESLSATGVGELGAPVKADGKNVYDNAHANVSGTFGVHGIGDVSVYGRKLNISGSQELGASLFRRF